MRKSRQTRSAESSGAYRVPGHVLERTSGAPQNREIRALGAREAWPDNRLRDFMLGEIVEYLRSHGVPFRLFSHPSPEQWPDVATRVPAGSSMVETRLLRVGDQLAIAAVPQGSNVSLARLRQELGTLAVEGNSGELPGPYAGANAPVPPLGGAFGALTMIDERVTGASSIAFPAFSKTEIIEIPYDDFARLERPKIASFAIEGELPEHAEPSAPESRLA